MAMEILENDSLVLRHFGDYQQLLNTYTGEFNNFPGGSTKLRFDGEGSGILLFEGGRGLKPLESNAGQHQIRTALEVFDGVRIM